MSLNVNKLADAYDKYKTEAPYESYLPVTEAVKNKLVRVKGKQWLGKKWIHADGSVTNKSCISILLSKWCVTRSLYKKLSKTDIKVVYINAREALNESYSKKFDEDKIAFCKREVALCKAVGLVICFDNYQRFSKMYDPNFPRVEQIRCHENCAYASNAKYCAIELLEKVTANPNDPSIPKLLEVLMAAKKQIQL